MLYNLCEHNLFMNYVTQNYIITETTTIPRRCISRSNHSSREWKVFL